LRGSNRTENSKPHHHRQSSRIDYAAINLSALAAMPGLLFRILPGGKLHGTEYCVRNPMRADKAPGSFKINIRTGRWADFAQYDARGGDIVSLVAYVDRSSQSVAALHLADMLGVRA
jgi:hypothetical protein